MSYFKQCEDLLAKHHNHVSPVVLAVSLIAVLGLISPTLLFAQELISSEPVPMTAPPTMTAPPEGQTIMDPNQTQPAPYQPAPYQNTMPPKDQYYQAPPMMDQGGTREGTQPREMQGPSAEQQAKMEAQNLRRLQQSTRGMEQQLKMFQNQITRLTKQGLTAPATVSENLTKLATLIQAIKNAKTFEEAQNAGLEDIGDLMQTLNEERGSLERLARWPQALKQVDRTLKNLTRSLTQNKTIATRLAKNNYDISDLIVKYEESVAELKASRDKAVELVKTDPEAAFSELEDNFFSQFEEVMQSDRTIKELGNLSRFNASFKTGVAEATRTIKVLKAKKVDTAALTSILDSVKAKGAEITALMKVKPVDTDAMVTIFEELDSLRQEFESAVNELTGDEAMPWEKGPQQFKQFNSGDINKYLPSTSGGQFEGGQF